MSAARTLRLLAALAALATAGVARAECDAPVECAPGKQVQRCTTCDSNHCGCWFKRTGEDDLPCGKGCACEGASAELDAWCQSPEPPNPPLSCGAAPAAVPLLLLLARRRRGAMLLAAGLLALSGCSKRYLRVDAAYPPPPPTSAPAPAARATDAFKARAAPVRRLVLRLPDRCYRPPAAKLAVPELEAGCAGWLAALEVAFREAGYEVLPWTALRTLELQEQLQPIPAARKLGAEALLNVSRLEATDVRGPGAAAPSLTISASNPKGEATGPAALTPDQEEAARAAVTSRLEALHAQLASGSSVSLDAAAVLAESGEWFFDYKVQWTRALRSPPQMSFLLRGRGERWRPVLPVGVEAGTQEGAPPAPADPGELIKAVATSVAERFRAEAG